MVTVEAAVALCAFVTVLAMVLAGMSMVLDQIRCTDAAREAARLVAMGARSEVADAVSQIAAPGATFSVTTRDDGIVVDVRDPAANGLLPGVHVSADAYAVPEPGTADDNPAVDGSPPAGNSPPADRSANAGSAGAGGSERMNSGANGGRTGAGGDAGNGGAAGKDSAADEQGGSGGRPGTRGGAGSGGRDGNGGGSGQENGSGGAADRLSRPTGGDGR
jgi:uncharacterized membrane protein YgcG